MAGREISVVLPVYNEADNVAPIVAALRHALAGRDWEALFVDDASPDGTAEAARRLSLQDDRVRVILRLSDRGLSRSAVQGLLSAKADVLCVMDADGQHDPALIPSLVDPIVRGEADVVSAARKLDQEDLGALGAARLRLSRMGNAVCRLVLGRRVHDPLTGYFAISRAAFLSVADRLGDSGFKLLLEILSSDPSLRHREVPFRMAERAHGRSKLGSLIVWQFAVFVASRLSRGLLPPAFVSFVMVGASGVVVHLAVLSAAMTLGAGFTPGQLAAATAATTWNFLLNNRLTFSDRRLSGPRLAIGYAKYVLVASVGIAANVSVATLAFEHITRAAALAALAGIAIDTVWKYVLSSRLVWR